VQNMARKRNAKAKVQAKRDERNAASAAAVALGGAEGDAEELAAEESPAVEEPAADVAEAAVAEAAEASSSSRPATAGWDAVDLDEALTVGSRVGGASFSRQFTSNADYDNDAGGFDCDAIDAMGEVEAAAAAAAAPVSPATSQRMAALEAELAAKAAAQESLELQLASSARLAASLELRASEQSAAIDALVRARQLDESLRRKEAEAAALKQTAADQAALIDELMAEVRSLKSRGGGLGDE